MTRWVELWFQLSSFKRIFEEGLILRINASVTKANPSERRGRKAKGLRTAMSMIAWLPLKGAYLVNFEMWYEKVEKGSYHDLSLQEKIILECKFFDYLRKTAARDRAKRTVAENPDSSGSTRLHALV